MTLDVRLHFCSDRAYRVFAGKLQKSDAAYAPKAVIDIVHFWPNLTLSISFGQQKNKIYTFQIYVIE